MQHEGLGFVSRTLIFHIWRYFPSVQVWIWKAKLWLMFLSTHSFQNLLPPWDLLFNLMSSLMPIFEKIYPMSGLCSPIWWIYSSSLCKQSEYLPQCLWLFFAEWLCSCFWLWSDDLSYLQKFWHPSRPLPFDTLNPWLWILFYCDFHSPSVYLNLKYFPRSRISSTCLIVSIFWLF